MKYEISEIAGRHVLHRYGEVHGVPNNAELQFWQERNAAHETLRAIEAVNVNEFGHTADEAIKRLIDSHFANNIISDSHENTR